MNRLDNDLISRKALLKAMQQVLNKENPSHAHIFSVITNAPTVKQLNELIADNQDLVTANNEKANEIVELQALIKNDAFAISFQSMAQYRKALLEAIK